MRKLPEEMKNKVEERLILFVSDPQHPLLNDHKLNAPLDGCRSINITGDYRLVYRKLSENIIELHAVGTHHEMYGE